MAKHTARIHFEQLLQDSQSLRSGDDHMVSRVRFSLEIKGRKFPGLHVDLKQSVGATEDDPIEVGQPHGYKGPMNYDGFRKCIEDYFRHCIGASGMIRLSKRDSNLRMKDNV